MEYKKEKRIYNIVCGTATVVLILWLVLKILGVIQAPMWIFGLIFYPFLMLNVIFNRRLEKKRKLQLDITLKKYHDKKMRKKIVAGNWKMNTTPAEGVALLKGVAAGMNDVCDCVTMVVAPPFTHLGLAVEAAQGSNVHVSAQNCAAEAKGAYTGEVSAQMIASLGVEYVILGHSERREYYGETSETLNKKMARVYENDLIPIYCIGEKLEERESGKHFDVVRAQVEEVVFNLTPEQFGKLVVAYEPVWAIGTGKTATSDQAQEIHAYIRGVLAEKFGEAANETAILYGGSANPGNAAELFSKPDVDGGLIGGASLKADDFIAVAKGFKKN